MTTCPHCGGALVILDPSKVRPGETYSSVSALVAAMRRTGPKGQRVSTYPGDRGGHFLTYIGGQIKEAALREAIRDGLLEPEYPERPDLDAWALKP